MAASYPSSIKTFVTRVDGAGNIIFAAHMNDVQDEINAVETGLINGLQHVLRPDSSANNRDIGLTTARFRDLFAKGTIDVDQGTITVDDPAWQSVATWNAAGVTFVHKDTNITDTASAAASILERWRVGAANRFSIRKDGLLSVGGAGGGLDFTTSASVRIGTTDVADVVLKRNNVDKFSIGASTITSVTPAFDFTAGAIVRLGTTDAFDIILKRANVDKVTVSATAVTVANQNLYIVAGALGQVGTNDAFDLNIVRNNIAKITIEAARVLVADPVAIGTNPSATGALRLANTGEIVFRNAANTADIRGISMSAGDILQLAPSGATDIQWTKPLVALGGGAAPTFGTIGGSGPATAAQNTWMRIIDSGGAAFWVPAWK